MRIQAAVFLRFFFIALSLLLGLGLSGCAGLFVQDEPRINVVGLEPLAGQGLEMRFNMKLRVQNPSDAAIVYNGIALELEVDDKPFASGVSNQKGSIPAFGETVLSVPVSVSAFAAMRQALGLADGAPLDNLPYVLRGKLAGGAFGTKRFSDKGTLTIPGMGG